MSLKRSETLCSDEDDESLCELADHCFGCRCSLVGDARRLDKTRLMLRFGAALVDDVCLTKHEYCSYGCWLRVLDTVYDGEKSWFYEMAKRVTKDVAQEEQQQQQPMDADLLSSTPYNDMPPILVSPPPAPKKARVTDYMEED
jgi:hypothetical protein